MKSKLIASLRAEQSMPYASAEAQIDRVFAALTAAVEKHGRISIPGFGAFTLKAVPERMVRNPRTGERIMKPATQVLKFKEAKTK